MKKVAIILVCLFYVFYPACEDEVICTEDIVSRVHAGLYVRDTAGQRDTVLSSLTFYAMLRTDSLLYDESPGIHEIVFPLPSITDGFTTYVFRTDSLADTIHIYHSPRQELVSFSCGFTTVHEIDGLSYGNNTIDTISIADPLVNLTDYENLKIYIRPAAADTVV